MPAAEQLEELMTIHRVRVVTGMGTTFIYERMKAGKFPRSIRVGRRALWVQSEVNAWIQTQIAESRKPTDER